MAESSKEQEPVDGKAAQPATGEGGFYSKLAGNASPFHACGICGVPRPSVVKPGAPCLICVRREKGRRLAAAQ